MTDAQHYRKYGFIQTSDPRVKRELYKLLYDKTYWPICAREQVVFRPDESFRKKVLAILRPPKTTPLALV